MGVYAKLMAKVGGLPEARHRRDPTYILFSTGGFTDDLIATAAQPENRLSLVGPEEFLRDM
jgi:hypothetical protein